MRILSSFLMGMLAGAALLYGATNYHLVRGKDGFHLIKKSRPRVSEAYVDVRRFGVNEWAQRQELVLAITEAGKQNLLTDPATAFIQDGINTALQGFAAPTTQTPPFQAQQ